VSLTLNHLLLKVIGDSPSIRRNPSFLASRIKRKATNGKTMQETKAVADDA